MNNNGWAWPWWTVIVSLNVLNLVLCSLAYRDSRLRGKSSDSSYGKRMRVMGLLFTLVAAYRSVFVSRYLTQMAWFDSIANSSLIIRLLATVAELVFAGLIASALLRLNSDVPDPSNRESSGLKRFLLTRTPYVLVGCIFLAQFFATSGLITKSRMLFAIEETLWSLGFLSVLPLSIIQLRRVFSIKGSEAEGLRSLKQSSVLIAGWCVFYCIYGLVYHLPFEYWPSAIEQLHTGLPAIKTGFGAVRDALMIVNESKAYGDWGFGFLLWHSAYFTVCVWIAIILMRAPQKQKS